MIGGEGLVELGIWLADRHDAYIKFMKRIQKMIAGITKAEKEERAKRNKVRKALLGYDLATWIRTEGKIRNGEGTMQGYQTIELPEVVTGRHKYQHCQRMYTDVHNFIRQRKWKR